MKFLRRIRSVATTCWWWLGATLRGATHWRERAELSADDAAWWRENSQWWQRHAGEWQEVATRYKEQAEITEGWAEECLRLRADHAATGAVLDEIIRVLATSDPGPPPPTNGVSRRLH